VWRQVWFFVRSFFLHLPKPVRGFTLNILKIFRALCRERILSISPLVPKVFVELLWDLVKCLVLGKFILLLLNIVWRRSKVRDFHNASSFQLQMVCSGIESKLLRWEGSQSVLKFIALSYRHCSTCFGHYNAHHQEPVKLPLQLLVSVWMWRWKCSQPWSVTNRPRLRTLPPPHSYGNQRLQRQYDGLLMMGIVMSETCWAVSVRQSNKFYDWLLHLVGCFIWVLFIYLYRC